MISRMRGESLERLQLAAPCRGGEGAAWMGSDEMGTCALEKGTDQVQGDGFLRRYCRIHTLANHSDSGKAVGVQRNRQKPEEQRKIGCPLYLWLFSVPLYFPMLFSELREPPHFRLHSA
jgi:hypothetical protein